MPDMALAVVGSGLSPPSVWERPSVSVSGQVWTEASPEWQIVDMDAPLYGKTLVHLCGGLIPLVGDTDDTLVGVELIDLLR